MEQNWTNETAELLNKINLETEKLLSDDLSIEEFHEKHKKLMKFWDDESNRLKEKYPIKRQTKAIPKTNHISRHMTDRFIMKKLLNKFYEE